jgi:uncharacterized protein YbjQ (UPF0145 family)
MKIVVTTGNEIPGKKISKVICVVKGSTVRAKHLGRDIAAGLKNLIGGEIESYTDLLRQAREEAYNRMVNEAIKKDADAIIGMRFMTSMVMQGSAEMLVYGTAVKFS